MDEEPTEATGLRQYNALDVNLRITALEMILKLTVGTRAIREYLEQMSYHMTEIRKKKIEQQRLRKE
jgi:alpha-1,3-glucosyltransferase